MPRKCPVCRQRHSPTCEEEQCLNCEETEDLQEHPEYSGDKLCQDCVVSFWEGKIEELESELEAAKDSLTEAKKG